MPHDYPDDFKTHLQSGATNLALLWKITRADNTVFTFTDHSDDIIYDGLTYRAAEGFTPSTLEQAELLSVDNAELAGMFAAAGITKADVRAGLFDGAAVVIYHIDYTDPANHVHIRANGTIGEMTVEGGAFKAEFRSLMQKLQQPVGRLVTSSCDALLGDARCSVNLTAFTVSGTVSAVTNTIIFTASALTQSNGYFKNGLMTFTSGLNNGTSREVKAFRDGTIELALPMPYAIAVSDTFDMIAGCDKSSVTCAAKFDNLLNFRGFPDVPGQDRVLRVYT